VSASPRGNDSAADNAPARPLARLDCSIVLNRQRCKALRTKGSFPSEDAARKLIYLAIQNAVPPWTRTHGGTKALLPFKIQFGDRLPD
jgi:transposase-like protein